MSAARAAKDDPFRRAMRGLIEAEGKRRCLAGGYPLDLPAAALTSHARRDGPLWQVYADKVAGEIERLEEAGFEVRAKSPSASYADDPDPDAPASAELFALGLIMMISLLALWVGGH